jgi:hypothetical protein
MYRTSVEFLCYHVAHRTYKHGCQMDLFGSEPWCRNHWSTATPFLYAGYVASNVVSWGGVRLSPLGTSATNWPIVPAPDDRWWMWSSRWNKNWHGKPKYSEKTCPSSTLSTTNPTWPDLGSNRGRRGGKPVTNRLSYGTVIAFSVYLHNCLITLRGVYINRVTIRT